jgi:hypothetical protein
MISFGMLLETVLINLEFLPTHFTYKTLVFDRVDFKLFSISEFCKGFYDYSKDNIHNTDCYEYIKTEVENGSKSKIRIVSI